MPWHPALDRLRDALTDLYPDVDDARRLAATATLAISRIVLQGKAVNVWQSILEEAEKAQQVEAVIAAAVSEYPQNAALRAAVEAYRMWAAQGQPHPYGRVSAEPALLDLVDFEMPLVNVPAGEFRMGSTHREPGLPSERPAHKLSLPGYLIGRYPVTVAQYRVFVQAGHRESHTPDSLRSPDDHPVAHVTWYEATAFCRWASQVSGRRVRLPSEAEWEKAARWDAVAERARIYPWGDVWGSHRSNTKESGRGATTPVGRYSPLWDSPYGCADMAGNVAEWTRSLWGTNLHAGSLWTLGSFPQSLAPLLGKPAADMSDKPAFYGYPYDPQDGREAADAGPEVYRVTRGGSFEGDESGVRCAARSPAKPDTHDAGHGFRVMVAVPL